MADERRGSKRPLDTSLDFEVPPADANAGGGSAAAEGVAAVDTAAPAETAASAARRVSQRQKQIDYGKNTPGYARYTQLVPREKRRPSQPRTPDVHAHCPKRLWDAQVREWRRALHRWDPEELRAQAARDEAAPEPAARSGDAGAPREDASPPAAEANQQSAHRDIYGSFEE